MVEQSPAAVEAKTRGGATALFLLALTAQRTDLARALLAANPAAAAVSQPPASLPFRALDPFQQEPGKEVFLLFPIITTDFLPQYLTMIPLSIWDIMVSKSVRVFQMSDSTNYRRAEHRSNPPATFRSTRRSQRRRRRQPSSRFSSSRPLLLTSRCFRLKIW